LNKGEGWPKGCIITLVLAEEDYGKLFDFVNELVEKAKSEVVKYLSAAAGTAIGAAIGSSLGPATAVVGAAVGYAVSKLVNVLKEWFEDDLFQPATLQFEVPSPDLEIKSEQKITWKGHGGHYELFFEWIRS
jgi:phage tail tape-measure protein